MWRSALWVNCEANAARLWVWPFWMAVKCLGRGRTKRTISTENCSVNRSDCVSVNENAGGFSFFFFSSFCSICWLLVFLEAILNIFNGWPCDWFLPCHIGMRIQQNMYSFFSLLWTFLLFYDFSSVGKTLRNNRQFIQNKTIFVIKPKRRCAGILNITSVVRYLTYWKFLEFIKK